MLTGSAELPNWLTSMGHSPALARGYWEKTKSSLLSGDLPYLLKALVSFVVSNENGAAYCAASHAHAVLQIDRTLRHADLLTLLEPDCRVPLTAADRAALLFAARMAWAPSAVEDHDFEKLLEVGFSRHDVQELLSVIDLTMMFNCYTSGMRLPLDERLQPALAA